MWYCWLFYYRLFSCLLSWLFLVCRCVQDDQRSFALGIQWIKVRLIGTIPAPMVFGALIDETCVLWQESCHEEDGACLVYDNQYMGWWVFPLSTVSVKFVEASWNVISHAQKPDFFFRRNGRVHLNRLRASVQSTTGSRGVRISGSNAEYTMFRGSVKSTGYPLHSPVFPSLPLPCVTVCHHISTGVYPVT